MGCGTDLGGFARLRSAGAVLSLLLAAWLLAAWLLAATAALAQSEGCVFDRRVYPEGSEVCRGGVLQRCEEGAWGDVGGCEDEASPPPESGGGDVEVDPEGEAPRGR
jgi:hypothetical protein